MREASFADFVTVLKPAMGYTGQRMAPAQWLWASVLFTSGWSAIRLERLPGCGRN
jgi:hypothetical protein